MGIKKIQLYEPATGMDIQTAICPAWFCGLYGHDLIQVRLDL